MIFLRNVSQRVNRSLFMPKWVNKSYLCQVKESWQNYHVQNVYVGFPVENSTSDSLAN